MIEELKQGRYLKFIYHNIKCQATDVKRRIFSGEIDIHASDIQYWELNKFKLAINGAYSKLAKIATA